MTNSQSTIEISARVQFNEEEIRRLEKRIKDLALEINFNPVEVQQKRKEAARQIPFELSPELVALSLISPRKLAKEIIVAIIGILGAEMIPTIKEGFRRGQEINKIDQSKLDLPGQPMAKAQALIRFLEEKEQFFHSNPTEEIAGKIVAKFNEKGILLRVEDIMAAKPEYAKYFDEEKIKKINEAVEQKLNIEQAVEEASQNLSLDDIAKPTVDFIEFGAGLLQEQERQIEIFKSLKNLGLDFGSEFSGSTESIIERTDAIDGEIQKKKEAIQLNKEDNQNLIDLGNNQGVIIASTKQLTENIEGRSESLRVGNEILDLTAEELLNLPGKLAMVNGAFVDTTASQTEFSSSLENLVNKSQDGAVIFGYTKEELLGLGSATSEAAEKAKDLDKNALKGVTDQAGKAEETLGTLNSTTGDLSARSKELADEQEHVTQAVADGSAVMDNAGASAEQFGEALEQVESSGGFFDGIKQGFIDFVENVESNSELMADFFANTLTEMSQNFSDLFYNVLTGKFDSLKDLANQVFESILRAFLDMVAAIATRQIVISIGGMFGLGKSSRATGGGSGDPLDLAQQGIGVAGSSAGLFGAGGAFSTFGTGITGGLAAVPGATAAGATASSLTAGAVASTPTAVVPGFMATAGAAITIVGAALAVAGLAYTIIAPLLKKTPRLDIDFDSVKTEVGRRAALVEEFLDPEFFMENIGQVSVKRGGVGIGAGGSNQILELIRERIEETIEGIQDIIAKLPTDMFRELNETLLGAEIDIDTVIAGERLLEFDAKGKKIAEKFQAFIEGELPAKFFASIRESFFDPAFRALGVSAEGTEALIDDFMAKMEAAGSREARAEVGAEFIATFNAFVDAFNIVSGNVNDSIGQTIQMEEMEYQMAA